MATYDYASIINPNDYIFSDLNARLPNVAPQDYTIVTDREAILQSIWRLIKTKEGEIPNYRGYGLDLDQFIQRPMNQMLVSNIDEYVSNKIEQYEPRVEVYKSQVLPDYVNSQVILQYYLKIKSTEEIIALEPITIPIG